MSRCPHCGLAVQPGVPACPRCGARLAPPPQQYDDPNMPPWLAQLQSQQSPYAPVDGNTGRVPAPPAYGAPAGPSMPQAPQQGWPQQWDGGMQGGQPPQRPGNPQRGGGQPGQAMPSQGRSLDMGQLFDESALPDWLRQMPDPSDRGRAAQGAPAPYPAGAANGYQAPPNGYQGQPPQSAPGGAFPPIERAGQGAYGPPAPGGMPAQSLLDNSALPTWLRGQGGGEPAPQYGQAMQGDPGLRAQSLVDDQALPSWLRAQPDSSAQQARPASPWGANPAPQPQQNPAWFDQSQGYGGQQAPQPSGWGAPPQAYAPPGDAASGSRVSASQFVDESALPGWLKAQGADSGQQPYGAPGQGNGGAGAAFAAADLVDPNALPAWMRGGDQQQANASSSNGWGQPQPPAGNSMGSSPSQGGSQPGRSRAASTLGEATGHRPRVRPPQQGMPPTAGTGMPLASAEMPVWLRPEPQDSGQPYQQDQWGRGGGGADGDWADGNNQGGYADYDDGYGAPGQPGGYDDQQYYGYDDQQAYDPRQRAARQPLNGANGAGEKPRGWRKFFRRK